MPYTCPWAPPSSLPAQVTLLAPDPYLQCLFVCFVSLLETKTCPCSCPSSFPLSLTTFTLPISICPYLSMPYLYPLSFNPCPCSLSLTPVPQPVSLIPCSFIYPPRADPYPESTLNRDPVHHFLTFYPVTYLGLGPWPYLYPYSLAYNSATDCPSRYVLTFTVR